MSVENDQINWSECPIGRKCETTIASMSEKVESAYKNDKRIEQSVHSLHTKMNDIETALSSIKSKLTVWSTVAFVIFTSLLTFIIDMISRLLDGHFGR